jgi:DNA-damage-inducible protein J
MPKEVIMLILCGILLFLCIYYVDFLPYYVNIPLEELKMAKVSTIISIDADIKSKAQAMLTDLGLDLSTAVNIFLRQMLRQREIPFAITQNVPNEVTLKAMDDAKNDIDMYGPFDTVEEVMRELNA